MSINIGSVVGKFLKGLSFLDGFGMVSTVIGLASMIFDYANADWEDHPTTDEIMDGIAELSEKVDTIAPSVIAAVNDLINDQVIGIRMQQLASALSGGQSARDLLASHRPGDDAMRNAIIVEASAAFRDTLAQAVAICTPSEAYDPSFEAINTSLAAVMQALTTRLTVAAQLEKDELAADKISNQMMAAAAFFEDVIGGYRAAMKPREYSYAPEQVDDGTIGGSTYWRFIVELDIDREFTEISDGEFVRLPPFRAEVLLQYYQFSDTERQLQEMQRDLEDLAFADLNMGTGGSSLSELAARYRALAAGVELTLPSRVGYDNSGTLTGGDGNDLLIGNDGDDRLEAGGGNDMLRGEEGDDTLLGQDGNDRLVGGSGNDSLMGGRGEDTFEGSGGDDLIYGDLEPDDGSVIYLYSLLDFSFDAARYRGLRSEYTVEYSHSTSVSVYDDSSGSVEIRAEYQTVLRVSGHDGNDTLTGVEQLFFDNQRVTVFEGSDNNDTNTGDASEDIMIGRGGDDSLNGGAGNDTMLGGTGNDTYYVDNAGDTTIELVDEGTDSVFSSVSYFLWSHSQHIENLTLTGTEDIGAGGNGLANILTGNVGDNVLDGGGGADQLIGGRGNDTYYVDNVGDTIVELYAQGTDTVISSVVFGLWEQNQFLENLILTGSRNINGSGNSLANEMTGNAGNNVLNGGGGADRMVGGLGDDTYYVDHAGDTAVEREGGGTDTVISSVSYELRAHNQFLENLVLAGIGNINGTGNGQANTITGTSGNNVLDGAYGNDMLIGGAGNDVFKDSGGADRMVGGQGNDIFYIDNVGDTIVELAGEGSDKGISTISFALWSQSQFIENLALAGSGNINGTGNGLANLITGTSGNNTLDGAFGNDILIGGAGNDIFKDAGGDDVFTGGAGADTFFFQTAGESDRITDFENGIDKITIGLGFTSFADITVTDSGADTILTFGTNIVTLANFDHALVSSDDFMFV